MNDSFLVSFLNSQDSFLANSLARKTSCELLSQKIPKNNSLIKYLLMYPETLSNLISNESIVLDKTIPSIIIANPDNFNTLLKEWGTNSLGFYLKQSPTQDFSFFSEAVAWSDPLNKEVLPKRFQDVGHYFLEQVSEKNALINKISAQAKVFGFPERVINQIAYVADEFLMNAAYDAPVDLLGQPLYKKTPRNSIVTIERPIALSLAFDGEYLCLSVQDSYGSINHNSLIKHIASLGQSGHKYVSSENSAGAGIGLAQSLQKGASLVFKVQKSVYTQACAFFKKTENYKEFTTQDQFLITNIK